jgi:thymidylate kinase
MSQRPNAPGAPRLIALEGLSGAGKSTVSRALARALGGTQVEEAYWRLSPRPSLDFAGDKELLRLERRLVREEFRRYAEAVRLMRQGDDVVLDTDLFGPLTYVRGLEMLGRAGPAVLAKLADQYREGLLRHRWAPPDLTVYLRVSEATAQRRAVRSRRRHPQRWQARHLAVGRTERRLYTDQLSPILGRRWYPVAATVPVAVVVARVVRRITTKMPPGRPSPALGLRLLHAILQRSANNHPNAETQRRSRRPSNR